MRSRWSWDRGNSCCSIACSWRNRNGVTLTVEKPFQETTPVLTADKLWEDMGIGSFNTVAFENGAFRMWYSAIASGEDGQMEYMLCHAESEDGVHWNKPELGLIAFRGSKNNSIVAPPRMAGASVFRDDQGPCLGTLQAVVEVLRQ